MELKSQKVKKLNCWEFMECGRQLGGSKVRYLGVCPVSREMKLNNVHGGRNAGRACWVVAGSLCGGARQGSFTDKFISCEKCTFYQQVKKEEGASFNISLILLNMLKKKKEETGTGVSKTDEHVMSGKNKTV